VAWRIVSGTVSACLGFTGPVFGSSAVRTQSAMRSFTDEHLDLGSTCVVADWGHMPSADARRGFTSRPPCDKRRLKLLSSWSLRLRWEGVGIDWPEVHS
jgi:hypothetical protein